MKESQHYDIFNKNTYIVPESERKMLEVLKNRYAIVIALAVLLYTLFDSIFILVGFCLVVLIYTEYIYRAKFLKKLTIIPTEKVVKENINTQALIVNAILYAVFGALLGYLALTTMEGFSKSLLIAVSAGAVVLSIRYLLEVITKK